jgi:hypothetical protein
MASIRCFLLEPTDRMALALRRYSKGPDHKVCPVHGYHTASARIGTGPAHWDHVDKVWHGPDWDPETREWRDDLGVTGYMGDERWPKVCACGYEFCQCGDPGCVVDAYQLFTDVIYRRSDTGEELTLRDAPAGALWYADWLIARSESWDPNVPHSWHPGPDGRVLQCKTPGGDWIIDSRASNCTLPQDNEHRCWIRHGTPPDITVDKDGNTCEAGAGSIQAGNYHGFLRAGHLED